MTGTQNKIIKKYKREIRQFFPIFTKNEKRFLMISAAPSQITQNRTQISL